MRMSDIVSYGISLPHFQIENQVLHPHFGKKRGTRAVIFADEDPITLAFDAGIRCLESFPQDNNIDSVIFASTTPVFKDRYHASFLAELLDIPKGILALDLCASPRSGTDAFFLADDLLSTGRFKNVLILAADTFFPAVGDEMKVPFGHAGCALLLSNQKGMAEVKSAHTYSSFIAEEYVYKDSTIQVDARFGRKAGFLSNISHALRSFLKAEDVKPDEFGAVILNSLYAKAAGGLFVKAGFDAENQFLMDTLQSQIGYTRACHALLLLIDALEKNSGSILLVDYGNGTNVFRIEQSDQMHTNKNVFDKQIKDGKLIESYQDYLLLEKAGRIDSTQRKQEMFSSDMMLEREKESIVHLKGFECTKCGTLYFIKSQRCNNCGGEDFTTKKLAKTGTVYTFTKEHYFPTSFPPVTMAVIDLDGGGRVTLQVTDQMYPHKMPQTIIGAKVELVFRKMIENDIKPNYFWKCRLVT
jgi:hydroxymethylglutaryl-CoA synthase